MDDSQYDANENGEGGAPRGQDAPLYVNGGQEEEDEELLTNAEASATAGIALGVVQQPSESNIINLGPPAAAETASNPIQGTLDGAILSQPNPSQAADPNGPSTHIDFSQLLGVPNLMHQSQ